MLLTLNIAVPGDVVSVVVTVAFADFVVVVVAVDVVVVVVTDS